MPDDLSGTPESIAAPQATEAHHAPYPVEAAYTQPGPYATTTSTVIDGAGNAIYDLYYPADYAALGFKSPIVTWGNGTGGIPPQYSTLLGHLASYGLPSSARPRRKPEVALRSAMLLTTWSLRLGPRAVSSMATSMPAASPRLVTPRVPAAPPGRR
jgi:hypothetical protein